VHAYSPRRSAPIRAQFSGFRYIRAAAGPQIAAMGADFRTKIKSMLSVLDGKMRPCARH
jgi:hypothetical protein